MDEVDQLMKIGLEDSHDTIIQMEGSSCDLERKDEMADTPKSNKEQNLIKLAKTGNIEALEKLLKEGEINLKYSDSNGQTALHFAAKSLHYTVCKKLVESDKSLLKLRDNGGNLPLHLSISSGKSSTKVVEFFLSYEEKKRPLKRKRQTPLHIASDKGNKDIVKLFIKYGVPLDDKDAEEFTALHLAARNGYTFCCEELVREGAEINVKSKNGQTPLHLAAKKRFTSCCSFLLESGADINIQDRYGNTALHLIHRTIRGTEECVRCVTVLLANDADPNILNIQGETTLQSAKKAPINVLKKFENTNINVTQTDVQGQTILHHVAGRKETAVCELILNMCELETEDKIKFVNLQDNKKCTALYCAIQSNNTESCKVLTKAGADVNIICDPQGNALHMVAEFGHEDICEFLITKGTKIDVINGNGKTALHIAACKGHIQICKSLLNNNSDGLLFDFDSNTALHLAAIEGHAQCCQLLVNKNPLNVNKINKNGRIPLHEAVINGMLECCNVLTNKKSDIWKKDKEGKSSVWYAYHQNHDDIFLLLLNSPNMGHSEKDLDFNDILKSAIKEKRRAVCEGFIKSKNWEEGLQILSSSTENNNFRDIIQTYPDLTKNILDKCISDICQVNDTTQEDTKSTYNFSYIDDKAPKYKISGENRTMGSFFKSFIYGWSDINSSWQSNHPVTLMAKKPGFLNHPVVTQWMHYKWRDYGGALYYSYICLILLQIYLLLLYFIKSWTWTTLQDHFGYNQTVVCTSGGGRLVGPEVETFTIEKNNVATIVGYTLLTFMVASFIYRIIRIPNSLLQFKTVLVLLTSVTCMLLVINFSTCSQNTHLKENIQWLSGYISSGFLLLILILTFGEHPSSSKMYFDFNTACHGVISILPLLSVVIVSSIYYQFSENIKNVTTLEPPTLWIIIISLISVFLLILNACNRKPYVRKGLLRNIDRRRRLAFVSLIMDLDVLFPPLRNWSYRQEITIEQDHQNCFSLNSMICRPCQEDDEGSEENDFENTLLNDISTIKLQLELITQKNTDIN